MTMFYKKYPDSIFYVELIYILIVILKCRTNLINLFAIRKGMTFCKLHSKICIIYFERFRCFKEGVTPNSDDETSSF